MKNLKRKKSVHLQEIRLQDNKLEGDLRMGMNGLFFSRQSIFFPGEIPESIGKCSKLETFTMWGNNLSGELRTGTKVFASLTSILP